MILLKHEIKNNLKSFLIWSLAVGLICWGCILLYKTMEGQLEDAATLYANMGDLTKAIGMDKVSLATLDGYYATEIALMFGLGAGMFAAMLGISSLSKEEEGHTSEFLYSLPYRRSAVFTWKFISLLIQVLLFNLICMGLEGLAVWQIDMDFSYDLFLRYHLLAFLMQLEILSVTFLLSALNRKKQIGLAFGLTLLFYIMDMMCRIVPDIEFLKYGTPYYLASGADVFSQTDLKPVFILIPCLVVLLSLLLGFTVHRKRDLAS